jgi:uncharacterized protein YecE (DUF72 family)
VFAKWAAETPDDFVFAVKAHRFAAQRKTAEEAREPVQRFVNSGLAELGSKLGPINWQFDPRRRFDPDHIDAFLGLLPAGAERPPAAPRAGGAPPELRRCGFAELLRKHGHAAVYTDAEDWPSIPDATADFRLRPPAARPRGGAAGYTPGSWTAGPPPPAPGPTADARTV